MTADATPIALERLADGRLSIVWSDDRRQVLAAAALRAACPCAGCRERQGTDSERAAVQIVSMSPAGNYAYHIQFSDGHSSGIYTLDMLRSLPSDTMTR